jgi:hypothetical protein
VNAAGRLLSSWILTWQIRAAAMSFAWLHTQDYQHIVAKCYPSFVQPGIETVSFLVEKLVFEHCGTYRLFVRVYDANAADLGSSSIPPTPAALATTAGSTSNLLRVELRSLMVAPTASIWITGAFPS